MAAPPTREAPKRGPVLAALLGVALIPVVLHWSTLTRVDRTFPWDFTGFHLPHLVIMQESARAGRFPLWDKYSYCGRPFAANPQTQAFYPPRWISVLLAEERSGLLTNLEIEAVAHMVAGSIFASLFARMLGCGWVAAALTGVAFSGGCFFASQAQHVGAIEAGAWLPAIWWSVARLVQSPGPQAKLWLAASLTGAVLTGFVPALVAIYGSAGLLAAALTWARRAPWKMVTAGFGIAAVLSIALSAILLLPATELANHSVGKFRLDWRGTGGGVPWEAFVSVISPNYYGFSDLAEFRLPYEITLCFLFGGFVPLLLVLCGFGKSRSDRLLKCLILLLVATSLFLLGDKTPVGLALWKALPAMARGSYYPNYWLMAFSLAFAAAAGLGLERIALPRHMKLGAVLLTAGELWYFNSGLPMNAARYQAGERVETASFGGDRATQALLAGSEARSSSAVRSRFDITDAGMEWVTSAALLGSPSANGYDPLALERLIQARLFFAKGHRWGAFYKVEQPDSSMLAFMNVDNLLAKAEFTSKHWTRVRPGPNFVYTRKHPSQRAYFIPNVLPARNMQEAAGLLQSFQWDPKQHAVAEFTGSPKTASVGQIEILSWIPGEIRLRTSNTSEGFAVISEAVYPGWTGTVDGDRVPVLPANVAFQGLWIPAGVHNVVLKYSPNIFLAGALLSAVGLAGAVLLARQRLRE